VSPEDLSDVEGKVYKLLETDKSIQEIADIGQLGEFDACQTVYDLIKKGWVEKVPGKKGKKAATRRVSFDFKAVFGNVTMLAVGIVVIIGIVLGLQMLPENFVLFHQPNISGMKAVAPLATRSRIQNISYYVRVYFFEHGTRPSSLEELVSIGSIPDSDLLRDAWGHSMTMTPDKNGVLLRSPGQDGEPDTGDDITLSVSF
jgi:hypothetical protein